MYAVALIAYIYGSAAENEDTTTNELVVK